MLKGASSSGMICLQCQFFWCLLLRFISSALEAIPPRGDQVKSVPSSKTATEQKDLRRFDRLMNVLSAFVKCGIHEARLSPMLGRIPRVVLPKPMAPMFFFNVMAARFEKFVIRMSDWMAM